MKRKPNKVGGGSKTNLNGLSFEGRTDLLTSFENHPHFNIQDNKVFKKEILIGEYYEKYSFYKNFLTPKGIKWNEINSKRYLPDSVFYNIEKKQFILLKRSFKKEGGP